MEMEDKADAVAQRSKALERMEDYLKKREEIFDFVIHRKALRTLLFWFSIFSAILFLLAAFGGKTVLDHVVRQRVNMAIAERVDEEYSYLKKRNEIAEEADKAIATGRVEYYDHLAALACDQRQQQRVRVAADAEALRVELFVVFHGKAPYYPAEKLRYTDESGQQFAGRAIPTEGLKRVYHQATGAGERTAALEVLGGRLERGVPEFLLGVAQETANLRERYVALSMLSVLLGEFPEDALDPSSGRDLWDKEKEGFYRRVKK
jgi:hypothetical protein